MIRVKYINIGRREKVRVGQKTLETGLYKKPITGPVMIKREGLENDAVVNNKYHGGADQAVYIYSQEDHEWWERELGRKLPPGFWGENLTIEGFPEWDPRVGDRLLIADLQLQLTAPRIPCNVLAARLGDPGFVKVFAAARRPGAYARVLSPGTVESGMEIHYKSADPSLPRIRELFDFAYAKERDADQIRGYLAAPIAVRMRRDLEEILDKMI